MIDDIPIPRKSRWVDKVNGNHITVLHLIGAGRGMNVVFRPDDWPQDGGLSTSRTRFVRQYKRADDVAALAGHK